MVRNIFKVSNKIKSRQKENPSSVATATAESILGNGLMSILGMKSGYTV